MARMNAPLVPQPKPKPTPPTRQQQQRQQQQRQQQPDATRAWRDRANVRWVAPSTFTPTEEKRRGLVSATPADAQGERQFIVTCHHCPQTLLLGPWGPMLHPDMIALWHAGWRRREGSMVVRWYCPACA